MANWIDNLYFICHQILCFITLCSSYLIRNCFFKFPKVILGVVHPKRCKQTDAKPRPQKSILKSNYLPPPPSFPGDVKLMYPCRVHLLKQIDKILKGQRRDTGCVGGSQSYVPERTQHEGQDWTSVWRKPYHWRVTPPGETLQGEVLVSCICTMWGEGLSGPWMVLYLSWAIVTALRRRLRMKEMYIMHELRLWLKGVEYLCFMWVKEVWAFFFNLGIHTPSLGRLVQPRTSDFVSF